MPVNKPVSETDALLALMEKLNDAKDSVSEEGTISADDLEKELGVK